MYIILSVVFRQVIYIMDGIHNWENLFPEIYEEMPVLLSEKTVRVFPFLSSSFNGYCVIAKVLCNLTGYYLDNLILLYHLAGDFPEIEEYLVDFAIFLKDEKIREKIGNWHDESFTDEAQATQFIAAIRKIPRPPKSIHPRLIKILDFIDILLQLSSRTNADFVYKFYNLSISWANSQLDPAMQLGPAVNILQAAEVQVKKSEKKQNTNFDFFYRWGKEYDQYFQKNISAGSSQKTSHRNARLKFIENHPPPKEECDEIVPGLSMNSLRKYQKFYWEWSQDHE